MVEKLEKVWNITDHPMTKVKEQALVLFGQTVLPGGYVKVPPSAIARSHKLKEDVANRLVAVGKAPPADYAAAKAPVALVLPATHSRARFAQSTNQPASPTGVAEAAPADAPSDVSAELKRGPNGGRRR